MARFDPNRNRNRNRNAEEPPSWVVTASPPNAQENPEASKSGLETHSSALHGVCSSCYGANGQLGSVALLIYSCPRTFIPSTDPEGRHGTDKWQKKRKKKKEIRSAAKRYRTRPLLNPFREEVVGPVVSRWWNAPRAEPYNDRERGGEGAREEEREQKMENGSKRGREKVREEEKG